jgi:hypothetical protein
MSLAGARLLARCCPAWRQREPGQAAFAWNGRKRGPILLPGQGGERARPLRLKPGGLSTDAGAQADWLVVAVKFLLAWWGWSEGVRSFVACSFDQPDAVPEGVA